VISEAWLTANPTRWTTEGAQRVISDLRYMVAPNFARDPSINTNQSGAIQIQTSNITLRRPRILCTRNDGDGWTWLSRWNLQSDAPPGPNLRMSGIQIGLSSVAGQIDNVIIEGAYVAGCPSQGIAWMQESNGITIRRPTVGTDTGYGAFLEMNGIGLLIHDPNNAGAALDPSRDMENVSVSDVLCVGTWGPAQGTDAASLKIGSEPSRQRSGEWIGANCLVVGTLAGTNSFDRIEARGESFTSIKVTESCKGTTLFEHVLAATFTIQNNSTETCEGITVQDSVFDKCMAWGTPARQSTALISGNIRTAADGVGATFNRVKFVNCDRRFFWNSTEPSFHATEQLGWNHGIELADFSQDPTMDEMPNVEVTNSVFVGFRGVNPSNLSIGGEGFAAKVEDNPSGGARGAILNGVEGTNQRALPACACSGDDFIDADGNVFFEYAEPAPDLSYDGTDDRRIFYSTTGGT
jgi:hypothetical protein